MALFGGFFDKVKALFDPIIKPAVGFFNLVVHTRDTIVGAKDSILSTSEGMLEIIDLIKGFSLDAKFKSRVVNVPKAIGEFEKVVTALKDIFEKLKEFKTMFKEAAGQGETTDLTDDVEGLDDLSEGVAKLGSKFAAVFEKGLGIVTFILMIAGNLQKQFDAISGLVNDVKTVLEDLDNLDGLFLPQKNARITVVTTSGQPIRQRVGKLHGKTR